MSKKPGSNHIQTRNHHAVVSQQVATASMFSGPIPPPDVLEHYDQVTPGLAERIVSMAEREAEHRHNIERFGAEQNLEAMRKTLVERRIGQYCAFIVALSAIGSAIFCATIGAHTVGGIIAGTAAVGMVSAFLYVRKK